MSSILKILVDVGCQVYCDYEFKGDAVPGTIFRIEMRKGNYILEFKQDGKLLLSQEYDMESNDEERLFKVTLSKVVGKNQKECQYEEIATLNVKVSRNYEKNIDEVFLENKDTHEKIRVPYNVSELYGLDSCGLLNVNIGGVAENKEVGIASGGWPDYQRTYNAGHWGCVDKIGNIQIPIIYDKPVYFYSPNITVAELNGKQLFINKWNEIVIENKWDEVKDSTPFQFGKCKVEKDGKQGVIDESGKEVLPLIYSKIKRISGQFAVQVDNKWGLVSDECKMLYPITLDDISYYYWPTDDHIIYKVKVGEKEGLLESTGRLVFPIVFDEISNTGDYILVRQNGLYGLYNEEKQILPIEFEEIKHEITSATSKYHDLFLASKNNLWGVFDSLGNIVLPEIYNKIEYSNDSFVIEKDSKWGYIPINGNTIPPIYDSITIHRWHLKCLIVQQGERFGLASTKGELLLPIEYFSISIEPIRGNPSYNGFVIVKGEDGLGIFTEDGSCIIKPEYEDICPGCGGFIVTSKDRTKGLFDKKGDTILPVLYEEINSIDTIVIDTKYIIATKSNNVWQLWNYSKEDGVQNIYWAKKDIDPSRADEPKQIRFKSYEKGQENQLIVEKNEEKKYNGYDYNYGNFAVLDYKKCQYIINHCDDIQKSKGNCYIFDRLGKKGLCNKEGEILYGNYYDEIVVKDELIYTIQDSCYLIYDYEGEEVFEKKYKKEGMVYGVGGKCGDRDYSACIVTKDGKWGCLNYDLQDIDSVLNIKKVKEIIPCEYDFVAFQDKTLYTDDTKEKDGWIRYFVKREKDNQLHYFKYQCHDNTAEIIEDWVWPYANAHYLFIDTETTGLPTDRDAAFFESDKWPYLVQISMLVLDSQMKIIGENNYVLTPENYTIPQSSSKIHGITNEYAKKYGMNRKDVLEYIRVLFQTVNCVIGHNVDFDVNILKAEIYREWGGDVWFYSLRFNVIDTMKLGADVCKIPSSIKGEKYKWPTLNELYRKLFGKSFEGQHNAMNDVKATYECYCKMTNRKI